MFQPSQFFLSQPFPTYDKFRPREGETKSQPHLSIHPQKSKEEDNIGVLTIPNDLKRNRRCWTKELVKITKITILNYLRVAKSKIPLILQKYRLWKNKIWQIWGFNNIQGWNPQKYSWNLKIYTNILRIYNVYWKSESTYNKSMIESEDRHAINESKYQINVQCNEWISRWIPIVSENKYTKYGSLPLFSWSQHHWLVCRDQRRIPKCK